MVERRFHLVVVRGVDAGARLVVDGTPRLIGRARNAHLPLTDVGVSRRHIEVVAGAEGVELTLVEGAAPFIVDGRESERCEARVGEQVIVGNTILAVIDPDSEGSRALEATDIEATLVQTLLTGLASDVRGLAGVFALVETLDAAPDAPAVAQIVADWARHYADVDETTLLTTDLIGADPNLAWLMARPNEMTSQPAPGVRDATLVIVPAHTSVPTAIAFRVRARPDRVSDHTRRLLAVAGRVCASSLARLSVIQSVVDENTNLRQLAVGSARAFLGASPAAVQIERLVPRLAASDSCVLLLGESGAGKTFVARLLHEAGPRSREPLRVINCAAIPESLLESELFGHERGAFTGALNARAGAFEAAGGGTVLLDEIGELPLTSQAKLLRVIEEKRFERIGSNRALTLNARVLTATNRDLAAMVKDGRFRGDLFFRISVVNVRIPALRERGDDVVLLAGQMLSDLAPSAGRRVAGFSPAALEVIRSYPWPGNVRELRNAIEHALVLGDGPTIEPADFPEAMRGTSRPIADDSDVVRLPANLAWLEARAIDAAMRATAGNRTRAAALLGINRVTLYKKLKEEPST